MASVRKNFLFHSVYQILKIVTPLVTTPYLARVLGPDQIGVYSYTESVASYFSIFIALGIATYGVRTISTCGADKNQRSRAFWSVWYSQLLIGIPICIVYFGYCFWSPNAPFICTFGWSLYVMSSLFDVSWLFFGAEEFKLPTIRACVIKFLEVTGIFVFVRSSNDVGAYVILDSFSFLALAISLWPFVKRYVYYVRPTLHEVLSHIPPNAKLFLPVVAVSLYTTFDRVLLGALADMEQTGFFDYADKLARMPLAAIAALGTVMLPRMSKLLSQNQQERALLTFEKALWAMLVCSFGLAFGIAACAPEFAPVFLGKEFVPAVPSMIILAWIVPMSCYTSAVGNQYLLPTFQDHKFIIACGIGALVNIGTGVVLIRYHGSVGAATATVIAQFGVLVADSLFVRRQLPLKRYASQALPFVAIGACMAFGIRVFASFTLPLFGLSSIQLILEILFGLCLYALLSTIYCLVTHNEHALELARPLLSRLNGLSHRTENHKD